MKKSTKTSRIPKKRKAGKGKAKIKGKGKKARKIKVKSKKRYKSLSSLFPKTKEQIERDKRIEEYRKRYYAYRKRLAIIEKERPLTPREAYDKKHHGVAECLTKEHQQLMDQHDTFKLQFELVPGPQFFMNVRNHIGEKNWDTIRFAVYEKAGKKCELCGGVGYKNRVECHEVWSYDIDNLIQKLEYFQCLCPYCHQVKHIRQSERFGNLDRSMQRFCDINGIDLETATKMREAAYEQWKIRNDYHWTLNVDHISQYGMKPEEFKINPVVMKRKDLQWQRDVIKEKMETNNNGKYEDMLKNVQSQLDSLRNKEQLELF